MKKLIIFAAILFSVSAAAQRQSYKDYFVNNLLMLDVTVSKGKCLPRGKENYVASRSFSYTSFEFSCLGFMIGYGWYFDGTYSSHQPVNVSSYTKSNGTHVNSYKRALPNHKGSQKKNYQASELYFGYWLPSIHINNFNFYSTPIIGISPESYISDDISMISNGKILVYGAGIKVGLSNIGITIRATNISASAGISLYMK